MTQVLTSIARRLWPDFDTFADPDRSQLLLEISGIIFSTPWIVVSLVWLMYLTDLGLIQNQWSSMLVFLAISIMVSRFPFFQIANMGGGKPGYSSSNLAVIPLISSYFIFGPTAVWLYILTTGVDYFANWRRSHSRNLRWNWIRNMTYNLGVTSMAILIGLSLYSYLGGQYPLSGLLPSELIAALIAILVAWSIDGFSFFLWWYSIYRIVLLPEFQDKVSALLFKQSFSFLITANIPGLFGILGTVIFIQMGLWFYLFFISGVILVSLLTKRLSEAVVFSQQKSSELDHLERLGRSIIAVPADASTLPQLLREHVPRMLTYQQIEIRLLDGETLLQDPDNRPPLSEGFWRWFQENPIFQEYLAGEPLPWTMESNDQPLILTPILSTDKGETLGGIGLIRSMYGYTGFSTDLRPALEVLAAQIASAINAADVFKRSLEHQKFVQELAFAGEIQASFLPDQIPTLDGWQISAKLIPARETSGDFYDFIPLPDGNLGIVVADVTDKGVGAALFMALSRTLIRSQALQYQSDPARVLTAANQRIMMDAKSGLFVTTFYGVLNPASGELIYTNAGHNPPYMFNYGDAIPAKILKATGVPLGIFEDKVWKQGVIDIDKKSTLVLYSDGITDAQNPSGDFFGEGRMLRVISDNLHLSAQDMQKAIIVAIEDFVGQAPQFDDITLVVISREF